MPLRFDDKTIKKLKAEGIVDLLIEYQKEQDNTVRELLGVVNNALDALKEAQSKSVSSNEVAKVELTKLQRDTTRVLETVSATLVAFKAMDQGVIASAIDKLTEKLDPTAISEEIKNLSIAMDRKDDWEVAFKIQRDSEGRLDTIHAKPI